MGQASQIAHDHSETMIQGHWNGQIVVFGHTNSLTHKITIVEDIVVGQGCPFGEACGARSELDIDGVVKLQFAGQGR